MATLIKQFSDFQGCKAALSLWSESPYAEQSLFHTRLNLDAEISDLLLMSNDREHSAMARGMHTGKNVAWSISKIRVNEVEVAVLD